MGDRSARFANGAVMVLLGADDNHDEVLLEAPPGDDEVQALEVAIATLQTALGTLRRVDNC